MLVLLAFLPRCRRFDTLCSLVQEWFADNEFWLVPYAAFCFLRDLFGTAEHWRWGTMSKPTPEVRSTLHNRLIVTVIRVACKCGFAAKGIPGCYMTAAFSISLC
jgi:hypothetical protein